LVGDAHQPMHISRKEDKGGNTIQVQFDGKGTNLHALWDSKLIDHEGLSEAEIARNYDVATPAQIKQWQADSPMEWIWESYQISNELYEQVKTGQNIDEAYYQKYIQVVRKRIDQAGIRLAGELNRLFNNEQISAVNVENTGSAPGNVPIEETVKLEDINSAVGKMVKVEGRVYSIKDIGSMVLVNLGAAYPNQLLTLALKGDAKTLETQLNNKTISVEGEVIDYKGKPEIIVTNPAKVKF